MNILKNKKFKFGALSILLTVAVIAVLVIANIIVSSLARRYVWYFDMTGNTVYTVSDEAKQLLNTIDGENNKVTIYFLTDEERIEASTVTSQTSLAGLDNVLKLAKELEDEYDFINIEFLDITKHPEVLKQIYGSKYKAELDSTKFTTKYVIIKNETYAKNKDGEFIVDTITGKKTPDTFIKTLTRDDFYAVGAKGSFSEFCADYKFASVMLWLCTPQSDAYFIEGHAETIGSTDKDYKDAQALANLLKDAGFNIRKINLANENFDSTSAAPSIAIIFNPNTDISYNDDSTRVSEYNKLKKFLDNESNHLMVFMGQNKATLKNLEKLLSEYGLGIENSKLHDSGDARISVDGYTLAGVYADGSVKDRIENTESKVIFSDARIVTADGGKGAYALVKAPSSSEPDSKVTYKDSTEMLLMAISEKEGKGSILLCGSVGFASNVNLFNNVYSNRDLMLSVIEEMGRKNTPINIEIKTLDTGKLDITRAQAIRFTVIMAAIIPIIVAGIGTFVYIRRRHA